ncbi:hypothetical protein [Duganella aceris]|nr:hypothetical protein [Duganella aceris]
MRAYLTIFSAITAITLGAVATLNYVVDPYLMHQWDTPQVQRLRPAREKLSPWGKTYALARYRPSVLYAGNSRTELGLPVQPALFGGKPVFNGALSGASVGDAVALVRHAAMAGGGQRLDTVVWGIDAPSFSLDGGNTDFERDLVATDSFYFWRRGLIDLKRALTIDMTMDSLRLLRGTFGQRCLSSLARYGQRDERCVLDHVDGWGGTSGAIVPRLREFIRAVGPTAEAMREFDVAVSGLCNAGTRVRLYINPTHAMSSDALYWSGKWPSMERWQRRLAELTHLRRTLGCDIRLFDFSGFNSITTEAIPQVSGDAVMRYYWEPSHYRVNVGRMILARLFGKQSYVSEDFGVELTPSSLPAHQSAQRALRDRYHQLHPVETSLVVDVATASGATSTAQPFSQVRSN